MTKVLLDSNILIYFSQKEAGEKHEIAKAEIYKYAHAGELVLSVQNLAEFSRVMGEKAPVKMDFERVNDYVARFSEFSQVLEYSSSTIILANSLAKKHKMHFFDALLAATMQENSIDEIMTEDVGSFKKIGGIRAVNPFEKK